MLFTPNPLQIIDYPADVNHYASNRLAYDFIFFHDTAGTNSLDWLSRTSNPPVSVHRYVARGSLPNHSTLYDGAIVKVVPDHLVAYTQGFGSIGGYPDNERDTANLNRVSLSIEFERAVGQLHTIEQLKSGAKQVVEWFGLYDMPSILYHWQVDANKDDPWAFPRNMFMKFVLDELKQYL